MQTRIKLAFVDDDAAFLFEFSQRLQALGFNVRSFRDGLALLSELERGLAIDCICADVRMPNLSGLELQQRLAAQQDYLPLILFTGYADVEIAVSAMKAGAWDFVGKPIDETRLAASIKAAVDDARRKVNEIGANARIAARVAELSDRHRQVLDLMVQGLTSKQIASALDINHRTVENYRAHVMDHIGVGNVAQLVRVMIQLETARHGRLPSSE